MTRIAQPVGLGPISNVGISPAGGGGIKEILVDIGFSIAETLITNYLVKPDNGNTKIPKNIKRKVIRKAFNPTVVNICSSTRPCT